MVPRDRARGNGHKLKHRKLLLYMRKNFTLGLTESWHRLPRVSVDFPSLEIFKSCVDEILCSLL